MRLAAIERLCAHVNFLHRSYPGEEFVAIKMDALKAFRQLAEPQCQRMWLAHRCEGRHYFNRTLVMGASANPDNMANAMLVMADWLCFWLQVLVLCFVDDWLAVTRKRLAGPVSAVITGTWSDVKWRWRPDKGAGEAVPVVIYLGVLVNLNERWLAVTEERRVKMIALLTAWLHGEVAPTATHFASLAGKLRFIAPLFPFGKAFTTSLYRFTDAAACPVLLREGEALPADVVLDLAWWRSMLAGPRVTMSFRDDDLPHPSSVVEFWSDASGSMFGAYCPAAKEYIQGDWLVEEVLGSDITQREWATVVMAFACWGHLGAGQFIRAWCDNMASVLGGQSLSFKDRRLRVLLRVRVLCALQMHTRAVCWLQHIPGVANVFADALSRGRPLPPQLAQFSRREVPPSIRGFISTLLSTRLSVRDTAVDPATQLSSRIWTTVMTSGPSSHLLLRTTFWSHRAVTATPHTGVC
jgi:hypothetical protein